MSVRTCVLAASGFVATLLMVAASDAQQAASAGHDAHPYVSFGCYQCHGYQAQGASSGPRLSGAMPYEAFEPIVRYPLGGMPAYPRELLSDADLRKIYSFIAGQPPSPQVKDLPLLYDTSK